MRKSLSLLLCLLLLLGHGISWAGTLTITDQQLSSLESIISELKQDYQTLSQSSTQSSRELIEVRERLKKSDLKLQEVSLDLQLSKNEIGETKKLLQQALDESKKLRELLETYEKQNKAKISQLKLERNLGYLAFIAALIFK